MIDQIGQQASVDWTAGCQQGCFEPACELLPLAWTAACSAAPAAAVAAALVVVVAAVELPPVAAAAALEGVTPVAAAVSETAQHFAAGHVAAVQKSGPAVVAAVALAVGAPAAAETAADLAQLHQDCSGWDALQVAAPQMGSAAMGIAAEHTLQPAQGVLAHCEDQRRGLEGGKTGAEQGLPADGQKMAGMAGEQGHLGDKKGGCGGPAYEAVQDRHEHDLAELAQRIETDS